MIVNGTEYEVKNYDDYYYKLILTDDVFKLACLQDFDECDYDQSKFATDKDGDQLKFYKVMIGEDGEEYYGESLAEEWMGENIKPEMIHTKHRKLNMNDYLK